MKFATVRNLKNQTSEMLQLAAKGTDVLIISGSFLEVNWIAPCAIWRDSHKSLWPRRGLNRYS